MKLLVTGAHGLVGRAVCQALAARGLPVRAAVRSASLGSTGAGTFVAGDMDGQTVWHAALEGIDCVLHLAARVHVMRDDSADPLAEFRRVNVDATLNLARQAADAGVQRLVFISSVKVNGEATLAGQAFTENDPPHPQDTYGQSKYEAEQGLLQIAAQTGLAVVIIRPPLVYGPGVKANFAALMRAVQRGWPLPLGAIDNRRSLVALDNLVDFILTCVSHPKAANQVFLVSDGQDVSTPALVRAMAQAVGRRARLLAMPWWLLQAVGRLLGQGDALARLGGNLQLDIAKAHTLLGWRPPVTMSQQLQKMQHD